MDINISCNSNAFHEWDLPSFSLSISARRHIRAGEEITVAYVDPELSHDERRKKLKHMYNFDCECEICVVEDKGRRVCRPLPSRAQQKSEI
jgi:SET domain-containing protein